MTYVVQNLPPDTDLETKAILKRLAGAHRYLAELKGVSDTIPNQGILINTLSIQEAKDSSTIENIITTHDELYKEALFPELKNNPAAKEVQNYVSALHKGFLSVKRIKLLTINHIQEIQAELEGNSAGFRAQPGTKLKNDKTGEVVYVPPQEKQRIVDLMNNLEKYINDDTVGQVDLLIRMAVIHFQFESIHPFYNGNGRTGRIINVLYLVLKELLDIPVLYLSRYFIQNKNEYYRLLQKVRDENSWEEWIVFVLTAVEETAKDTIITIQKIREALMQYKHQIRKECKFYSQDLINNLFSYPYTKIEYIERDLKVTRLTATKYLDQLTNLGFLKKHKLGRSNYYINKALYKILAKDNL